MKDIELIGLAIVPRAATVERHHCFQVRPNLPAAH